MAQSTISDNSRRIARNTIFLYCRMLLLMLVGLFTSRIVLQTLGVDDYGTYNVVGGVVSMFTIVTAAISTAITRYLTCELGKGDEARLARVFSTSMVIQLCICALVFVLTETLGLWFLNRCMDIPAGRLGAANWVLQCSMGILMASLLSVPFNASIIAHEHMKAFAIISVVEALLKLSVALLLFISPADKLKTYAVLMLAVALAVRFAYGFYCRKNFPESRSGLHFDRDLMKEMSAFAGWNVLGSGTYLVNTQGVNILTNLFFGVAVNAARGVAAQVDNIVKQFVNNVVIAINPQITKSYVSGNKDYSFDLVRKGSKYACLIILVFAVPVFFEADFLLGLWLGKVPEGSALFTKLTLVCLLLDLLCTTFSTLILAHGRIRNFYIAISGVSLLIFPISWLAFALGADAFMAYVAFIGVYVVADVLKLMILNRQTGFPIGRFLKEVILPVCAVAAISLCASCLVWYFQDEGWLRLLSVLGISTLSIAVSSYCLALTPGEREFVKSRFSHVQR